MAPYCYFSELTYESQHFQLKADSNKITFKNTTAIMNYAVLKIFA